MSRAPEALIALAGLLILCAVGFHYGRATTADLDWPHYHDAWRDIGMAQTILDGRYPEDNVLLGETLWYNPLAAAVVAAGSWISGLPAHLVDTRLGAYVNLLIPVFFFALAWALFDPWTALAATVFLMAGNSRDDSYGAWFSTVTYSPLLFAPVFAQSLFYLTLLLYWKARRSERIGWHVSTGLAWGVTFMAHTAPAVILGCVFALLTLAQLWSARIEGLRSRRCREIVGKFLLSGLTAFVVSLPYTYSILLNYQFRVVNIYPTLYLDPVLELSRVPLFLKQCVSLSTAVAALGLVALAVHRPQRLTRGVVLCWLGVGFVFLFEIYAYQIAKSHWGIALRQLVPGHHFLISLTGLKALCFGCGLTTISGGAASGTERLIGRLATRSLPIPGQVSRTLRAVSALAAIAITGAILYPSYPSRVQFKPAYDGGWMTTSFEDRKHAYQWVLGHCAPTDVFLCEEQLAERIVAPAARKAVVTLDVFSNPYVPYDERRVDAAAMFDALNHRDIARFRTLASPYRVTHLLVQDEAGIARTGWASAPSFERIEALALPFLELVYHADGLAIYRVIIA